MVIGDIDQKTTIRTYPLWRDRVLQKPRRA